MKQSVFKFSILLLSLIMVAGCATSVPIHVQAVQSPLGLYRSNTDAQFWLAILENNVYLVCNTQRCDQGNYERVPVDYGVILLDFYVSDIGKLIEMQIHGPSKSDEFLQAMRAVRLNQVRANDLVFNVTDCNGIPCVGIGHSRDGVKFYRVESFDSFWIN